MRLRVVIQRRGLIRAPVPLRPLVKLSSCDKQQRSFSHPKLLTGQLPNRRATPSYPLRRHQLLFAPASPNLGRSPGSLSQEFEPSEQTIRNWVKQAELDEGLRSDGLTTEARAELVRLKREVKRLRMERDILNGAVATTP